MPTATARTGVRKVEPLALSTWSSAMMAAPITVTGATLEAGAPAMLFATRIYGSGADRGGGRQYDVTRDGRFLINTVPDEVPAPITLLQNWNPEVKK